MNSEIQLPCDVGAEKLVLGAMLSDDTRSAEIIEELTSADFSLQKHQLIFSRAKDLLKRSAPISRGTVAMELEAHKELKGTGGVTYLTSLSEDVPRLPVLRHYLDAIREKSALRALFMLTQDAQQRALDASGSSDEIKMDLIGRMNETIRPSASDAERVGSVIQSIGINRIMSGRDAGIPTGFHRIDDMLSGLHRGELVLIAARPSMGKTAFAMNVALHQALHGAKVAVFSLEMTRQSLLHRMIGAQARVATHGRNVNQFSRDEKNRINVACSQLEEISLFISDKSSLTVYEILKEVRTLKRKYGLDVVIIDYLQLLTPHHKQQQANRNLEVGEQARILKTALAKDLDVCCVTLSQLSRAPEARAGNHRPILSDLRDSGELEQHADTVGFLFREEVYKQDAQQLKGQAEFIIAKQRNGPVGWVRLTFLDKYAKFENHNSEEL